METLAIAPRLNLARNILRSIERPTRLGDIDLADDLQQLDELIAKYGGGHCTSFEFEDDNRKRGYRALEYNIVTEVYTGAWENDCGTAVAVTARHKETISVEVRADMTLDAIARLIAQEIRGIDGNRFA